MAEEALTFSAALSGSRVELSDGTIWRVAPDMFAQLRSWAAGDPVAIQEQQANLFWPQRLANLGNGSWVSVTSSAGRAGGLGPFGGSLG
jgi:hypothetical protein